MLVIKRINSLLLVLLACLIMLVCSLSAREQQAEKKEQNSKARLGVTVITPDGETDQRGALVSRVLSGQAAEQAGLLKGDLIIRADNLEVKDVFGLVSLIQEKKPGERIEIVVLRDGREEKLSAVLGTGKAGNFVVFGPAEFDWHGFSRGGYLGVTLNRLDENLAAYFGTVSDGGALVLEVGRETPAARAGLLPGDVIIGADETEIKEPGDLVSFLAGKGKGDQVSIKLLRQKKKKELQVELTAGGHFLSGRRFETFFPGLDADGEKLAAGIREISGHELSGLKEKLEELSGEMQELGRELRQKLGPEREKIIQRMEKIKSRVGTRVFRAVSV